MELLGTKQAPTTNAEQYGPLLPEQVLLDSLSGVITSYEEGRLPPECEYTDASFS